jgi:hypothetical protein
MRAPASFPLFQSSRKIRRTNCLFSEDISPAPLAQDCITAEGRWEACDPPVVHQRSLNHRHSDTVSRIRPNRITNGMGWSSITRCMLTAWLLESMAQSARSPTMCENVRLPLDKQQSFVV